MEQAKVEQIVNMLCEGVGIRATARLTGVRPESVLNALETIGAKCVTFLDSRIQNLTVDSVQCDEIFGFVHHKDRKGDPLDSDEGTQYIFLAIERVSKLILAHHIGKRNRENCQTFTDELRKRVAGSPQITTDGFNGYLPAIFNTFDCDVQYATQIKRYADYGTTVALYPGHRRYSPKGVTSVRTKVHIGFPDREKISTSHCERTNLSVRLFNRRMTRLTLGYSKKLINLKYATALFIAHFNFCRVHSTPKCTPAQAHKLTDHAWTIGELLASI